jgi:hypothetical protein
VEIEDTNDTGGHVVVTRLGLQTQASIRYLVAVICDEADCPDSLVYNPGGFFLVGQMTDSGAPK